MFIHRLNKKLRKYQVQAATKLFSGAPAAFGAPSNTSVAPFDVAMPGTLPRLNTAVVDAAVRLGFALGERHPNARCIPS